MQKVTSLSLLILGGALSLIGRDGAPSEAIPRLTAGARVESSTAGTTSQPKRLDSGYPLPPPEPALSEVRGIRILDWGYRFTRPGRPDNSILIQAKLKNESEKARDCLLVAGLRHGVPWVLPVPAWFRVDMRQLHLTPGEEKSLTVEFPELQNIHLGVKAEFYVPRVLVKDVEDFNDASRAVEGVKILDWNYTIVARPRGPRPAKFVAVLRNLSQAPKRVVLRTELIPKPDAQDYEGPPEGFTEDHVVQIPDGAGLHLANLPMLSTSGISRWQAPEIFDAGIHIVSVEQP